MLFNGILSLAALMPALVMGHATSDKSAGVSEKIHGSASHQHKTAAKPNTLGPYTFTAGLWEKGFGEQEIKVYGGGVFVNTKKGTKSTPYCPITNSTLSLCKKLNSTLAWFELAGTEYNTSLPLVLATSVPGGQVLFVNESTGALQYTRAHSNGPLDGKIPIIPHVSIQDDGVPTLHNEYTPGSADFFYCETGTKGEWSLNVFRPTSEKCLKGYIEFRKAHRGEKRGAWQYNP